MYNGLEIDMLNLGDADCFVLSRWDSGAVTRVLVDGGCKKDAPTIQAFLDSLKITHIDHLVCSHIHDDHAKGLVDLVNSSTFSIGQAWLHTPANHIDRQEMAYVLNEAGRAGVKFARIINASLQTIDDLHDALESRGIPMREPFQGNVIGFLTVCGPSVGFYEQKLQEFSDYDQLLEEHSKLTQQEYVVGLESFSKAGTGEPGLLEEPVTDPENEVSVILKTIYNNNKYLLTADAGVQGLTRAKETYDLADLAFMQIPHHGSRRNITQRLINYFSPKTAYVSAVGNDSHPRRAVVNAFKKAGGKVFSTHYPDPGGHKWHSAGDVPERSNYSGATPLYETN